MALLHAHPAVDALGGARPFGLQLRRQLAAIWADPAWLDGLLPIQLYGLEIAVPGLR
jgi:hypothetical protein